VPLPFISFLKEEKKEITPLVKETFRELFLDAAFPFALGFASAPTGNGTRACMSAALGGGPPICASCSFGITSCSCAPFGGGVLLREGLKGFHTPLRSTKACPLISRVSSGSHSLPSWIHPGLAAMARQVVQEPAGCKECVKMCCCLLHRI
jgi:hypothetical protein